MTALARIPFSPREEDALTSLGAWMLFAAVFHVVLGLASVVGGCLGSGVAVGTFGASPIFAVIQLFQMVLALALGGILAVQGYTLIRARGALQNVVQTDDADQQNLVDALLGLKTFFLVEVAYFGVNLGGSMLQLVAAFAMPEGLLGAQDGMGLPFGAGLSEALEELGVAR